MLGTRPILAVLLQFFDAASRGAALSVVRS